MVAAALNTLKEETQGEIVELVLDNEFESLLREAQTLEPTPNEVIIAALAYAEEHAYLTGSESDDILFQRIENIYSELTGEKKPAGKLFGALGELFKRKKKVFEEAQEDNERIQDELDDDIVPTANGAEIPTKNDAEFTSTHAEDASSNYEEGASGEVPIE